MSKAAFVAAQSSSNSFLCPHCRLAVQKNEICSLKESVGHLLSRVAELESNLGLQHQDISAGTPVNYPSATSGVRSPPTATNAAKDRMGPPV